MPNWCHNVVTVTADADQVRRVVDAVAGEGTAFSLNSIVPGVEGDDGWYEWRLEHWGTKWDVDADPATLTPVGDKLAATWVFSSAWSPPTAALAALAAKYQVRVSATFSEPGNGYWGAGCWVDGEEWDVETPAPHPNMGIDTAAGWVHVNAGGLVSVYDTAEELVNHHEETITPLQPTLVLLGEDNDTVEPRAELFIELVNGPDGDEVVSEFVEELTSEWGQHCAAFFEAVATQSRTGENVARWAILGYVVTRDDDFWYGPTPELGEVSNILTQVAGVLPDARACVELVDRVKAENLPLAAHALQAALQAQA